VARELVRRTEAGQSVPTGPVSAARTAAAFRFSGTLTTRTPGESNAGIVQRDRRRRHRRHVGEVAFADLLLTRYVVEPDLADPPRIVEVGDERLVERQVAVLADPHQHEIDRCRP